MYHFIYSILLLLASLVLSDARTIFISHNGEKIYLPSSSESEVCMTPTCVISAAGVLTSLDETVDPCDDFYSFACGGWMKRNELSEDQQEMNIIIATKNELARKLRDLLESKYESSDPPFVKIMKDFYNSCVDVDTLEKQGSEPLKKMLRRLGGWPVIEGSQWDESTFDWVHTLISFRKLGLDHKIFFDLYPSPNILDFQDPYMKRLGYTNLTLGLEDPEIAAYYRMMLKAAKLLGAEEMTVEKEMLEALRFEIALTNITMSGDDEDSFGEKQNETESTVAKLQKELPQVPWLKIINGLLLNYEVFENQTIINDNPDFLIKFADLISSTEKRVIANYMLWRAILQSKDYLSEEWKDIEEDEEHNKSWKRWKQCLIELMDNMEIGISSYYVRHYFSDESKDEVMMMMKYIHKEFLKILEKNDWMDDKTREKAEEKANAMKTFIGYPKELLNDTYMMNVFENLTITTDRYLENILSLHKLETDKRFSRFKQSSKNSCKFEFLMAVQAFYTPYQNSIEIPAGILQGAFYDKNRPKYMNFGAIGHTIGHEITHGFDNTGRKFDKDGNQIDWWDKESDEHFLKKVHCIIDQYDNYTTNIGIKVNGAWTQDENIADNGGLKEAYWGYQSWTKDNGIEPLLPGVNYTQSQLFWISSALLQCSKYQPKRLKEKMLTETHSPGKFRVIGSMSNVPEFSKDFKCSSDAPMNRKYKCEVW